MRPQTTEVRLYGMPCARVASQYLQNMKCLHMQPCKPEFHGESPGPFLSSHCASPESRIWEIPQVPEDLNPISRISWLKFTKHQGWALESSVYNRKVGSEGSLSSQAAEGMGWKLKVEAGQDCFTVKEAFRNEGSRWGGQFNQLWLQGSWCLPDPITLTVWLPAEGFFLGEQEAKENKFPSTTTTDNFSLHMCGISSC